MPISRHLTRCLALAMLAATPVAAAPAAANPEIEALLAQLAASDCRFERNGSQYDGSSAQLHLRRKYEAALRRAPAIEAEEFIAQLATGSSLSGRTYRVACAGVPVVSSADWFGEQLRRLREDPDPGR